MQSGVHFGGTGIGRQISKVTLTLVSEVTLTLVPERVVVLDTQSERHFGTRSDRHFECQIMEFVKFDESDAYFGV